jgi:hypothetical protein
MPTEELESELRRVLARAAADIPHPEQAGQRLLQRNYRPGRGHRQLAAGIAATTAAAAVVLGLGLSGVLGSAPARGTGTIRTAAFIVVEHANGTATVTIKNAVQVLLDDPGALQRVLRHDRIPALVTAGRFCSSHPVPRGIAKVLPRWAAESRAFTAPYGRATGPVRIPTSFTINPAAMRAGTELSFGNFRLLDSHSPRIETIIELIDTKSYTCTSTTPHAPPHGKGFEVVTALASPAGP